MKNNRILPEEYLKDVLVRLAHHSSAIEGNTISLADTVSIILHNTIPGKTDLRELYEVANHREAFEYVVDCIANKVPLTTNVIKDIHEFLTDRLLVDKGRFKSSENAILGADFKTALPTETPQLMEQWVGNLNYRLEHAKTSEEIVKTITDFHIQFERIHPFSDGNGRTGRMLMNYSLLEKSLPPLIIKGESKIEYVNILANQDIDKFSKFASDLLKEESQRLEMFLNKQRLQTSDFPSIKKKIDEIEL